MPMCGLAGILCFDPDAIVTARELEPMVAALTPRGPDGTGYHTEPGIGLGHARLSIIDLEGGDQPIHNEDEHHLDGLQRRDLQLRRTARRPRTRGHRFYTHSDTEVIVHLYEEYGDDFVTHLNGQFAIALWDAPRRRLLLARDRPGIRPCTTAAGTATAVRLRGQGAVAGDEVPRRNSIPRHSTSS